MDATTVNRTVRAFGMVLSVVVALLMCGPGAGVAHANVAVPAGDVVAIGDPAAPTKIDLYVDPLCPFSGKMIQQQGERIGQLIEAGELQVNLRLVAFLEKYSASGTYDHRAIHAVYAVAGQSQSSDITWRFVRQIFSADQQPKEGGDTDLSNQQLAGLAHRVGAPLLAQSLITIGLPIGYDPRAIAANNFTKLRQFPDAAVPLVVIDGRAVDGQSDWLGELAG